MLNNNKNQLLNNQNKLLNHQLNQHKLQFNNHNNHQLLNQFQLKTPNKLNNWNNFNKSYNKEWAKCNKHSKLANHKAKFHHNKCK